MNVLRQWFARFDKGRQRLIVRWIGHLAAWLPLLILFLDFWYYRLGAEPIREVTLRTGKWALIWLTASLAVTPVTAITGWRQLFPLRRIWGLYTVMYVSLHLLNFVVRDYNLDLRLVAEEIILRRYALVGLAAFLLLLPLAVTSTKGWQRRLGKRWSRLHKLVYLVGILAVVHFTWLVKNAYTQPAIFAAIMFVLLLLRWKPLKTLVQRQRRRLLQRVSPTRRVGHRPATGR